MIEHRPNPKTDVKIGKEIFKCNVHGVVMLPDIYPQFNPVENPKKKKKESIED